MNLKRSDLKAIVKELLLEILNEGLRASQPSLSNQVQERAQRPHAQSFRRVHDPSLDTPVGKQGRAQTDALKEAIKKEAGGNPMMAAIFADTAATTLAEQSSHGHASPDRGSSSAPTAQEQFSGTPEQVFGDSSARWADLAFAEPAKKSA